MRTLSAFISCAWGPTPKRRTGLRPVATFGAILLLTGITLLGSSTSPLADAVEKLDRASIQALLKEHADVNAAQADGMTALHWAAYHDDSELVGMLLKAGANVA